jgi:fumarate hydratase subunit beta
MITLELPADSARYGTLKAGDECRLSGTIYVARDQAHKRMLEWLAAGKELPFGLTGETIYYMGPTPAPPGKPIGSAGPTTSSRMDPFTPKLLNLGLKGMIGKGPRSKEVIEAVRRNAAVYFYAFGGCGALYASKILTAEMIGFEDLGPEAVLKISIMDFPVIVAADASGGSLL